jgi:murein L,D-transpeptidase YafK
MPKGAGYLTARDVSHVMKNLMLLISLLPTLAFAVELPKADLVLVKKGERKMYLIKNEKPFREYKVALGANPKGHKQREGDERTPEGKYILDQKRSKSAFYKAIRISYPNAQDKERAKESGVNPGGLIMIHGQKNGFGWLGSITQSFDWTDGCIAVKNDEMNEIWASVDEGTPIIIEP